jgi:hypothetical protein
MPTYEVEERFWLDYRQLSREARAQFLRARNHLLADLRVGVAFRASLRVRAMQGFPGVWEMTWEGNDGRATFSLTTRNGQRHVIWRRVGGHAIFDNP